MNKPEVSVGIVSYNQRGFLQACIESCLEQDFESFEIVVADDASTDGTQAMLLDYCDRYPGKVLAVLQPVNRGITANCNDLVRACKGKYLAFMGGDDLMLQGKIQKQFEFMEANPECAICYHDLDVFDSDSGVSLYNFNAESAPEGKIEVAIREGCFNGACSTFVRASEMPTEGFDERVPIASDWLFWVETLARGGEIRHLPEILGRYRLHGSNITGRSKLPGRAFNDAKLDHLVSTQLMLQKYPQHTVSVLHRYFIILFSTLGLKPVIPALLSSVLRGFVLLAKRRVKLWFRIFSQ